MDGPPLGADPFHEMDVNLQNWIEKRINEEVGNNA